MGTPPILLFPNVPQSSMTQYLPHAFQKGPLPTSLPDKLLFILYNSTTAPGGTFPHSSLHLNGSLSIPTFQYLIHCLLIAAYLWILSSSSQGLWLLHPGIPRVTYSAWHFRNTENNVWLCFNKGSTQSSEMERIIRILTKEYYLVVL